MHAKKTEAAPVTFEPEFIAAIKQLSEELICFNQVLGLKLDHITLTEVTAHIDMRPQLVGHFAYNRIHGGAISAGLDAMGGIALMVALAAKHMDEPVLQRMQRFAKIGTIDLRVDYLRPGIGERFTLRAEVLRLGSRVGTTRMEFLGADGALLSAGMAAYIVS